LVSVRSYSLIIVLVLILVGCQDVAPETEAPTLAATSEDAAMLAPEETASVAPPVLSRDPAPAETPSPEPIPSATTMVLDVLPMATSTASATDLAVSEDQVFIYPVPAIYEGDPVTFLVRPEVPPIVDSSAVVVQIDVGDSLSLSRSLTTNNLAGSPSALFTWDWETEGQVGEHVITVTVDPADLIVTGDEDPTNNQVTLTVPVLPARARPVREQGAQWVTAETDCCVLNVVTGTAAHRDLTQLKGIVELAVQEAATTLGVTVEKPLHFYLIDRVIGQGGYASSTIVVSYLDRNYVGEGISELVTHEAVHLLDQQFAPSRISFLAEGLAVWVTGGHYKEEDVDQRVQALRESGLYVPLVQLVDDFYAHQHEVGYLQAGGFIQFLVERYGWDEVRSFYGEVGVDTAATPSQLLDQGLQRHFGRTLAAVEADWLAYLDTLPREPDTVTDLLTTIRYYNIIRDYQLQYDPTAHFLQAWLPPPTELQQRQITADLTRHPNGELNVTLEVMLLAVDRALRSGDLNGANVILDSVERALDNGGLFLDPLGINYNEIVRKLMAVGLEVHQVELGGNRALAQVTEGRLIALRPVDLLLRNQTWVLLN
jgi:hypothetical protein